MVIRVPGYLHFIVDFFYVDVMYIFHHLSKASPIWKTLMGLCLGSGLTHCTLVSLAVAGVPTAASCSPLTAYTRPPRMFPCSSMCLCHWMLQHVNPKFGIFQQHSIDEASISKVTLRTLAGIRGKHQTELGSWAFKAFQLRSQCNMYADH